jgi:hypothetical protein
MTSTLIGKARGGASALAASDEFAAGRAMNIRAHIITAMRNSIVSHGVV